MSELRPRWVAWVSVAALAAFAARALLDLLFVMPQFAGAGPGYLAALLALVALLAGWALALRAAGRGSRRGWTIVLLFSLVVSFGLGLSTLIAWCPPPCPTVWPLMELTNWLNVGLGAAAAVAAATQLVRQPAGHGRKEIAMVATGTQRPGLAERIGWWFSVWNSPRIYALHRAAYRLSGGWLGGRMRGIPVLLLTTTGRRTGKRRTRGLMYLADGPSFVVVASNAGEDAPPAWWLNLRAHPEAVMQVGRATLPVVAHEADSEERARLWPLLTQMNPFFERFQQRTARVLPVVILRPRSLAPAREDGG